MYRQDLSRVSPPSHTGKKINRTIPHRQVNEGAPRSGRALMPTVTMSRPRGTGRACPQVGLRASIDRGAESLAASTGSALDQHQGNGAHLAPTRRLTGPPGPATLCIKEAATAALRPTRAGPLPRISRREPASRLRKSRLRSMHGLLDARMAVPANKPPSPSFLGRRAGSPGWARPSRRRVGRRDVAHRLRPGHAGGRRTGLSARGPPVPTRPCVSIRDDGGDLHTFKVAQLTACAAHRTAPGANRCAVSCRSPCYSSPLGCPQPRRKVACARAQLRPGALFRLPRDGARRRVLCRSRRRSDSPPLSGGDAGRSPGGGHHDDNPTMPEFQLDPAQINDVIAYLQSLAP